MSKWKLSTDVNNVTHTATYILGSLIIHNTTLHSYLTAWSLHYTHTLQHGHLQHLQFEHFIIE